MRNTRKLQIRQARGIRVADAPTLSVLVVVEKTNHSDLEACLETLIPVCVRFDAQLVVVSAADEEELRDFRRAYPTTRFAAAPPGTPVAEMKALGMQVADGDIVLFQPAVPIQGDWIPPRVFER